MKIGSFKTDTARAESGDWIDVPALPGVAFKVRGNRTVDAKAFRAKLVAAIPATDRVDRKAMILHEARIDAEVALSCLDDWKGLEDDNGKPLAYSPDVARKMLLDPDFERLTTIVLGCCDAVSEVKVAAIEEDAKN